MSEFWQQQNSQIQALTAQVCQHLPASWGRRRLETELFKLIYQSLKLMGRQCPHYHPLDDEIGKPKDPDYYPDALQLTLSYCHRNLCQGKNNTGKVYDSSKGSVLNWLKDYLCYRLYDFWVKEQEERRNNPPPPNIGVDDPEPPEPEAPPDSSPALAMLEDVRTWAEADLSGELRGCHVANHPEANCQVLILRRLPPETPWKEISRELRLPIPTLSGHYQQKCKRMLRQFGQSQGYF